MPFRSRNSNPPAPAVTHRVKADLQQVVVTPEYAAQKVQRADKDGEDGLASDSFAVAKQIVLDDGGFWRDLVTCLRVAMPLVKLLRMLDSNKPVIGKVYHRMFLLGEKLRKMKSATPWIAEAESIHSRRWEYLHSDFHAAAYALDPEFIGVADDLDDATQQGLLNVLEKLSLRDAILSSSDPESAAKTLTVESHEVVQRITQAEREFSTYSTKSGPFGRVSVQINAREMDPAAWWSMYGKHLPLLSKFATIVLAQVGSASACERNWSVFGRIRAGRPRLGHVKCDKLVYSHEALALHRKLLDAGHQIDVESWEAASDSDSNASSENDLTVELGEDSLLQLMV